MVVMRDQKREAEQRAEVPVNVKNNLAQGQTRQPSLALQNSERLSLAMGREAESGERGVQTNLHASFHHLEWIGQHCSYQLAAGSRQQGVCGVLRNRRELGHQSVSDLGYDIEGQEGRMNDWSGWVAMSPDRNELLQVFKDRPVQGGMTRERESRQESFVHASHALYPDQLSCLSCTTHPHTHPPRAGAVRLIGQGGAQARVSYT